MSRGGWGGGGGRSSQFAADTPEIQARVERWHCWPWLKFNLAFLFLLTFMADLGFLPVLGINKTVRLWWDCLFTELWYATWLVQKLRASYTTNQMQIKTNCDFISCGFPGLAPLNSCFHWFTIAIFVFCTPVAWWAVSKYPLQFSTLETMKEVRVTLISTVC